MPAPTGWYQVMRSPRAAPWAGERGAADVLPDPEHYQNAEKAQQDPDDPTYRHPLDTQHQGGDRQHEQRCGGVPDTGQH